MAYGPETGFFFTLAVKLLVGGDQIKPQIIRIPKFKSKVSQVNQNFSIWLLSVDSLSLLFLNLWTKSW